VIEAASRSAKGETGVWFGGASSMINERLRMDDTVLPRYKRQQPRGRYSASGCTLSGIRWRAILQLSQRKKSDIRR
jgi:hypothetical protein